MKVKTKYILSINVYGNLHFLLKQFESIDKHIIDYYIIVSCNNYMYNKLTEMKLPSNIIINNEIINKKKYTKLLLKGIISNMRLAFSNFYFLYFIILSPKKLFYNFLNFSFENEPVCSDINEFYNNKYITFQKNDNWLWNKLKELENYFISKNIKLYDSSNDSLILNYNILNKILYYF